MKIYNWKEKTNQEEIKEIKKVIEENGLIIFPTETVYGIAASALSKKAIDKLYKAKKRPREKAINIMVSDKKEIEKYANINSKIERKIIDKYMPGEITIILEKKNDFGKSFTLPNNTIGIRIPNNSIALKIIKELKIPLIVSSANISGMESGKNPKEIEKFFNKSVDILIDGGIIEKGVPSTIIKVDNDKIEILREGKITKKEIENSIKEC